MDKQQLNQIKYIKSEIMTIEMQINNLEPMSVLDSVKGSSPYFPYTATNFHIEGMDEENYEYRLKRLQNKLKRKRLELMNLLEETNEFIDRIEDSLVRQIIILKYIEGMSWQGVASVIGGNNTASSVRMAVNRFLN